MKSEQELRYEVKYVVPRGQTTNLYRWLYNSQAILQPEYPARVVNTLYYDSPDYESTNECLTDAFEKNKVRLRYYDDTPSLGFLEVKKKEGALNTKSRYSLKDQNLSPNLSEAMNVISTLTDREFSHSMYLKKPIIQNRYKREYYAAKNQEFNGLRVTIDSNIQYGKVQHNSFLPMVLDEAGSFVLELKYPPSLHEKVVEITKSIPTELSKNSKFMNGVSRFFPVQI